MNINELIQLVNDNIVTYIPFQEDRSKILTESEEYSLRAGGKRLRPVLFLSTVQMLGGDVYDALPVACAIEYIHTYSLIHDDLPAMDNDDFRRGRPSNHKVYGENIAILAGDGLLTAAFYLISTSLQSVSGPNALMVLKAITEGAYRMVNGQVADVSFKDDTISNDEYDFIVSNKTGALFRSAVMAGAYYSGANDAELQHLSDFSDYFGRAFQIADDIDDFNKEETVNFARSFGLEKAKRLCGELSKKAETALSIFKDADNLLELCKYIKING